MRVKIDEDTKIWHLKNDWGVTTLCGLMDGWTDQEKPVKKLYGTNCNNCQKVVKEIKKLKKNVKRKTN